MGFGFHRLGVEDADPIRSETKVRILLESANREGNMTSAKDLLFLRAEKYLRLISKAERWNFVSGIPNACPWLINWKTDRVVAYHGFHPDYSYVGWMRGGPVWVIKDTEIIPFLKGEIDPNPVTHRRQDLSNDSGARR